MSIVELEKFMFFLTLNLHVFNLTTVSVEHKYGLNISYFEIQEKIQLY